MPLSASTFGNFGGALSSVGGAVADLYAAQGEEYKTQGAEFERQNYLLASQLATQNEQFTAQSTAIKEGQADRQLYMSLGKTSANVAGAGLAASGSALDILRSSAQEGATTRAVIGQQGLITEAGYQEQAASYNNLASAAQVAELADEEAAKGDKLASIFDFAGAGMKALAGFGSLADLPSLFSSSAPAAAAQPVAATGPTSSVLTAADYALATPPPAPKPPARAAATGPTSSALVGAALAGL
jgi:hypothetical protein